MAREGNVNMNGEILDSYTIDYPTMDLAAANLVTSLNLVNHGVGAYNTITRNSYVSDFKETMSSYVIATVDNTLTNKSVYDLMYLGGTYHYLLPPCATVFDDFDDASIDTGKWQTNGSVTEGATGYIELTSAGAYITSKTNFGSGGANVTYLRIPIAGNTNGTTTVRKVQASSVTGAGGSQIDLYSTPVTGFATVLDIWISSGTAYVYAAGSFSGSVSIAGLGATWYPRLTLVSTNGGGTPTFDCYNCSYNFPATPTIYLTATNTENSKNIGSVVLAGGLYTPYFSSTSGCSVIPKFSIDNGSNYVAASYGELTATGFDTTNCPFLFAFSRTDYRGKAKIEFAIDNTGTDFGYYVLDRVMYTMRE